MENKLFLGKDLPLRTSRGSGNRRECRTTEHPIPSTERLSGDGLFEPDAGAVEAGIRGDVRRVRHDPV